MPGGEKKDYVAICLHLQRLETLLAYFNDIKRMWVVLSKTYQSLHRLSANRVKLSEFVGLIHASVPVNWVPVGLVPSPTGTYLTDMSFTETLI